MPNGDNAIDKQDNPDDNNRNRMRIMQSMYESIWHAHSQRETDIISFIGHFIIAIGVMAYSIANEGRYIFPATFIAIVICTYAICLVILTSYWARINLAIISNIENEVKINGEKNSKIIVPLKWREESNKKYNLLEIHKIHIAAFIVIAIFSLYAFYWYKCCGINQSYILDCLRCISEVVILSEFIAALIFAIFLYIRCAEKFKKDFPK